LGIVLEKELENGSIVYIQFDNKGRGTLEGKTLYIKKSPTSAANASDETSSFTSETTEPELFSDNVTPKGGGVNSAPSFFHIVVLMCEICGMNIKS
ncbi:MAG: hypothetical protein RR797_06775, partial [Christensenella sp.]